MQTIILAGWRDGLQPVALVSLQRELLQLSLKEAKENIDRLLAVEADILPTSSVVLQVPDEVANEFASRADELGVHIGFVSFRAAQIPTRPALTTRNTNSQQAA